MGFHALLQRNFPTQGSNPGLLHCRQILYHLSHQGCVVSGSLICAASQGGACGKEITCQYRRHKRCRFDPWVGKIPWRTVWQPTPVFLLENLVDRRAWWDTVHRVAENRTRLKRLSTQHSTFSSVQSSPVAQSCPTLCDPMNRISRYLIIHILIEMTIQCFTLVMQNSLHKYILSRCF